MRKLFLEGYTFCTNRVVMGLPHYERNLTARCDMDKDKKLSKCPECNGTLSSEVARGWCKGEWSDYYCHYCQKDFFEHQLADRESSESRELHT